MIKVWLVTLTDENVLAGNRQQVQGVVTYMLPVEAFVTGIKVFYWQKSVFDCLIVSFEALDHLIKTKMQLSFLHKRLFTQWYGTGFSGTLIKLLWTYYIIK